MPPSQRALVLERAEGNPLFIEEIARMLREDEGLDRIPDSVQALIAARIDRLEAGEKRVLQTAALIGRVFWRGALDRLLPDLDVEPLLDGLLDREFVVPEERSTISGDRAFRFKHVLIRDVAYGGMSKAQRADEHRAFAEWVDERARDELAGIRAYHLDQAVQLLDELGGSVSEQLAHEAAAALEQAGPPRAAARRVRLRPPNAPARGRARADARGGGTWPHTRRGGCRTSRPSAQRPRLRWPTPARPASPISRAARSCCSPTWR